MTLICFDVIKKKKNDCDNIFSISIKTKNFIDIHKSSQKDVS